MRGDILPKRAQEILEERHRELAVSDRMTQGEKQRFVLSRSWPVPVLTRGPRTGHRRVQTRQPLVQQPVALVG